MRSLKTTNSKTRDLAYIGIMAALMAVCSWIAIPSAIPFTLQTMGVFLAIGILGGKRGTLAVVTYILLGALGVPVFAGFTGGIGVILGTTGGYIVGFLFSALLMWGLEVWLGRGNAALAISMAAGLLVCYAFGTLWYLVVYTRNTGAIGLGTVLLRCVAPFIVPDLLKISLALFLTSRLRNHIN